MTYTSHLSKELRTRYGRRSIAVRKGDKVKVMKGDFRGTESKVESSFPKKGIVHLEKAKTKKPDGSEVYYPIKMPNIMITELDISDPKRKRIIDRKKVMKNAS